MEVVSKAKDKDKDKDEDKAKDKAKAGPNRAVISVAHEVVEVGAHRHAKQVKTLALLMMEMTMEVINKWRHLYATV